MGLIDHLAAWAGYEKRASSAGPLTDPFVQAAFGMMPLSSRQTVNARTVENISTALACVQAIGSAIGSLPAYVYRPVEGGRTDDPAHPVARLIRRGPNAHQSWPDFIEWLVASALLRGNALAEIVIDGRGAVVELRPIPWERVTVQLLPSGRLAYDVVDANGIYGGTGKMRRLLAYEVLHLRDRTDDGLIGRSRLSRAGEVFGASLAVQHFTGAMFANGAHPSGALEVQGRLPPEAKKQLREAFEAMHRGPSNAAKALILDQGVTWKQISVSPEDAELLASRRFTTEEIARIFQVPPPLVGIWDHSSFTNSETAGRWFAQHTLAPWIRKIEAEFTRSVFSDASPAYLEFDLGGFLRGDPESRWRSHEIAVKNRILTPNEIREAEGYNPRPGGDEFPAPAAAPQPTGAE